MGFFDFLEQIFLTVPQGKWILLPPWLGNKTVEKKKQPEALYSASLEPPAVLNRRHCGQCQHSVVAGRKARAIESQKQGAIRREKAAPKRKKAKPESQVYSFKRKRK